MRFVIAAFSLVELLISLFLCTLLGSLALHQYGAVKTQFGKMSFALHENMEETLSLDLLRESILHAGFTPYGPMQRLKAVTENKPGFEILQAPQQGFVARRMGTDFVPLISAQNTRLTISSSLQLKKQEELMICNWCCYQRAVIKTILREKNTQKIILSSPLHPVFQSQTFVGRWQEERYELKFPQQSFSALYYHQRHSERLSGNWQELHIQKMPSKENILRINLRTKKGKEYTLFSRMPNV